MRPAKHLEAFAAAPLNRYVVTPRFVFWCRDASLRGVALWGRLGESDIETLTQLAEDQRAMIAPWGVVQDVRLVESFDAAAVGRYLAWVRAHLHQEDKEIRRRAVIHGDGIPALVATGFFSLLGMRKTWRAFADASEAFRWLGRPDHDGLRAELDEIIERARAPVPAMGQVRAYLAANVAVANADALARVPADEWRKRAREGV